jgi:hypothetical protein
MFSSAKLELVFIMKWERKEIFKRNQCDSRYFNGDGCMESLSRLSLFVWLIYKNKPQG